MFLLKFHVLLLLACYCLTTLAAPNLQTTSFWDRKSPCFPAPKDYTATERDLQFLFRIQRSPLKRPELNGKIIIRDPIEPEQNNAAPIVP